VVDEFGAGIRGAVVELHEQHQQTRTDSTGAFVLPNIACGHHHLHVGAAGFEALALYLDVLHDTLVRITLMPAITQTEEVLVEDQYGRQQAQQVQTFLTVDAQTLRRTSSFSLSESLERLPGVTFQNIGVGQAKPVLRGLQANRVVVVENGIRLEGQQWGADHGLEIDPFNADEVEILLGPSSLQYGSDALGGVVGIRSLALPAAGSWRAGGQLLYRSINDNYTASFQTAGNFNGKVFRARISYQEFADYRVPTTQFRYNRFRLPLPDGVLKNTSGTERSANILTGVQRKWGYSYVTAGVFYQHIGYFAGAAGIPRSYQLNPVGNQRDTELPAMRLHHWRVTNHTVVKVGRYWLRVDGGYQFNEREEFGYPHFRGQPVDSANTLEHGFYLTTFSLNAKLERTWTPRLRSVWGVSADQQFNRFGGYEFLLPKFNRGSAGVFSEWVWQPRPHITVSGGARAEWGHVQIVQHIQARYNAQGRYLGEWQRNPDIRKHYLAPSGAIGVSWFPRRTINLKLNTSSAFRFPQPYELAANGIHHGTFRHEVGLSTLKPERGYGLDGGLYFNPRKWAISITPFVTYFTNHIYLQPAAEFSFLPEGGQLYRYTESAAMYWGGELSVRYVIIKNLTIGTTGELVRSRDATGDFPMPFQPPANAMAEAEYRLPKCGKFRNVYLQVEWQVVEDQPRVVRNELATAGYALVNVRAGFSLPFKWLPLQVSMQVQNVTNRTYLRHLSRYRLLNVPEPGRNVVIGLMVPLEFNREAHIH
jgi:iron complex outermembrane receptor protein